MSSEVKSLTAGYRKQHRGTSILPLKFSGERQLTADYVCIACGGYPKAAMFDWLKQLGHTIEEPVPSLVYL